MYGKVVIEYVRLQCVLLLLNKSVFIADLGNNQ